MVSVNQITPKHMRAKRYIVSLTEEERQMLEKLISTGKTSARKINHGRILLLANINQAGGGRTDEQISSAKNISIRTIERVRQRFVCDRIENALNPRPKSSSKLKKIDGETEAHLYALACSQTPMGYSRWTLRLLAEQMVVLEYKDKHIS